ncbi:MAG TPA: sialate O-acetylesterase [Chthoniobacterales bacterium]|jgi:sialate O-acetylesterase
MRLSPFLLALLCLGAPLCADVVPNFLFSNNAILQRDKPIPVWGTADAGEKVTVTFTGKTAAATADATGKWRVELPALPANATPADLVIKGKNTLTFTNVLVGEVWLASGQSNMEQTIKETYDAALDIPGSVQFPMIRHIRTDSKVSSTPMTTNTAQWKVPGPATTGDFTAIGYHFALTLYKNLNVPVGIINSTRGASNIRGWMDPVALKSDTTISDIAAGWVDNRAKAEAKYPELKAKLDAEVAKWEADKAAAEAAGKPFPARKPDEGWGGFAGGPNDQGMPSGLYNGMIHPVVPYALRGVIWYQGEANNGQHNGYDRLFQALINGWRKQFGQGDFPFYWCHLAAHGSPLGTKMAYFREAQSKALVLPNTGQALPIDVGDSGNIHPGRKQEVGRRLARVALNRTYNQKMIDSGPIFKAAVREGAGYRVTFTESALQHRLVLMNDKLRGFELAAADQIFKPALAELSQDRTSILVTSPDVLEPVAVRYAWRDFPQADLYNREGLPAVPFRSDDWPQTGE